MNEIIKAAFFQERVVYYPEKRPGYTAWACLFKFGNGDIGISFNEIRPGKRTNFVPINLEFLEAMNLPYRICPDIFPACNPDLLSEYVYMKSTDNGNTWTETGRCEVDTRHYWTAGYPDGRMVRLIGTQEYRYEIGDERHCAVVEESFDGGNTWKEISRFLEGYFFYGHKFKKLKNGVLIAAGPVLPSFGPGGKAPTRNCENPGEFGPKQTAFMYSADGGYSWTGPHYILPGLESSEPDFVELADGSILFINSTVQAGRAVTQIVKPSNTGFINEPVRRIKLGSPKIESDVQGGFTPETITLLDNGVIVGARRGGSYSCSGDFGDNWYEIADMPNCKYQPFIETLDDGRVMAVWHEGADSRYGEYDMFIGTHEFRLEGMPPRGSELSLERNLHHDGNKFDNTFYATLTSDGKPLEGKKIEFRICPAWLNNDKRNPIKVQDSDDVRTAITDNNGRAVVVLSDKQIIPDIHHAYWIAASFTPQADDNCGFAESHAMMVYALTGERNNPAPHPIYLNHGLLMLRPDTAEKYPEIFDLIQKLDKDNPDISVEDFKKLIGDDRRGEEILKLLQDNNIIEMRENDMCYWYRSVHHKKVIEEVRICELKEYVQ